MQLYCLLILEDNVILRTKQTTSTNTFKKKVFQVCIFKMWIQNLKGKSTGLCSSMKRSTMPTDAKTQHLDKMISKKQSRERGGKKMMKT